MSSQIHCIDVAWLSEDQGNWDGWNLSKGHVCDCLLQAKLDGLKLLFYNTKLVSTSDAYYDFFFFGQFAAFFE